MADEAPKRKGRPGRTPQAGERVSLGLRVTAEMKARIDEAAALSGRSQSQEAEIRLLNSFQSEERAGGPEEAAMLSLVASAFMRGGQMAAQWKWKDGAGASAWVNDPYCFQQACLALGKVLSMMEPEGEVEAPGVEAGQEAPSDMRARMERTFSQMMGGVAVNSLFHELGINPKRDTRERRRTKALRIGPGGEDLSVQEPRESDNG
jgi:hypothetical protein